MWETGGVVFVPDCSGIFQIFGGNAGVEEKIEAFPRWSEAKFVLDNAKQVHANLQMRTLFISDHIEYLHDFTEVKPECQKIKI